MLLGKEGYQGRKEGTEEHRSEGTKERKNEEICRKEGRKQVQG
jgi:hypothetical protein